MELLNENRFIDWIASRGVSLDRQSPQGELILNESAASIYWELPEIPVVLPFYIQCFLKHLEPWDSCILWKRGSSWDYAPQKFFDINGNSVPRTEILGKKVLANEDVWEVIVSSIGIQEHFCGAVLFDVTELNKILALTFVQMCLGWSVTDDIFIVPDHGNELIQIDHHKVIRMSFTRRETVNDYLKALYINGINLCESQPPDHTFKQRDGFYRICE